MPDFLGSIAVFTVVITIFLFSWNSVVNQQGSTAEFESMKRNAVYTASLLVTSEGSPENWTNETVEIPGFATSDNFLSEEKISQFREIDYENQSRLLKSENFNLTLKSDSEVIMIGGEKASFGKKISPNATSIVPIEREVLVNRSGTVEGATLRYVVWQ